MKNSISLSKFKILSGSMLKLFAIISMLIDHTAIVLGPEIAFMTMPFFAIGEKEITLYFIMRKLGRLAFPIFCFLVSEGAYHTKNIKKYGLGLLIFAAISEIPYNLMIGGKFIYHQSQNVYFTLFLGVLLIYLFENVKPEIIKAVFMLAVGILTILLRTDYGLRGVLLILLLYVLRNHAAAQAILSYPLLSGGYAAFAAFIPINMYNGQRGFVKSKILKYGFYIFYPLHITLLLIIKFILKQ